MFKFGVALLLTILSVTVFADPAFSDRQAKENEKILALNYKFQTVNFAKLCKKSEIPSDCFERQLSEMHDKDKLSMQGLMTAFPAGKGLINNEKEKQLAAKPKTPSAEHNLATQKKQTEFTLFLLKLSCTAASSKDWGVTDEKFIKSEELSSKNYLKTLKKIAEENLEQVRKYSEAEAITLRMKFDTTQLCEKK